MAPIRISSSRYLASAFAVLLAVIAGPPEASAEPDSFRFKPGPRSVTRSFAIAELGYAVRVIGAKRTPGDGAGTFVSDHGILFNVSDRYAIGPVLHGEAVSRRTRLGPTLRLRRWLDDRSSVDVEAGAMFLGAESAGIDFRQPSPFVQVSLSAGDILVVYVQAQSHAVHLRGNFPHTGGLPATGIDQDYDDVVTHAGLKLGTVPGRAATVVVLILTGITFLAFSQWED